MQLKNTTRQLRSWNDKQVGCVKLQLVLARELIFRFDMAMELRQLSEFERQLRARLKLAYLGLASHHG
jgi:hypothetical protein